MVWSWPGRIAEGRVVSRVTSLLDVGPTLLDLAGADPLPGVSGRNLTGFLRGSGEVADWPDEAFSEVVSEGVERPGRMVRQGPWKLNFYHGYDAPQIFNLEEDPEEFEDRAGDPACAAVRERLLARVRAGWDGDRIEAELKRRAEGRALIRRWAGRVPHDLSDFWQAPPGCNVFPEE
jgi:choline-sulfatase